jgi:hypothetical protein
MKRLKNIIYSSVVCLSLCATLGCTHYQMDRSYVNDPMMDLNPAMATSEVSPLSGLNNRSQSSGGNSCSVCAH